MTYTIFNTFRPYDFGTDAIERQRVSLGQSIIDADFEYGLQGTKWQSYQEVRKTPGFFEIPGTDLTVTNVISDGAAGQSLIEASVVPAPTQVGSFSSSTTMNQTISNYSGQTTTVGNPVVGRVTIMLNVNTPHYITPGITFQVEIAGITGGSTGTLNGVHTATSLDSYNYTIAAPAGATGTFTCNGTSKFLTAIGYIQSGTGTLVNNGQYVTGTAINNAIVGVVTLVGWGYHPVNGNYAGTLLYSNQTWLTPSIAGSSSFITTTGFNPQHQQGWEPNGHMTTSDIAQVIVNSTTTISVSKTLSITTSTFHNVASGTVMTVEISDMTPNGTLGTGILNGIFQATSTGQNTYQIDGTVYGANGQFLTAGSTTRFLTHIGIPLSYPTGTVSAMDNQFRLYNNTIYYVPAPALSSVTTSSNHNIPYGSQFNISFYGTGNGYLNNYGLFRATSTGVNTYTFTMPPGQGTTSVSGGQTFFNPMFSGVYSLNSGQVTYTIEPAPTETNFTLNVNHYIPQGTYFPLTFVNCTRSSGSLNAVLNGTYTARSTGIQSFAFTSINPQTSTFTVYNNSVQIFIPSPVTSLGKYISGPVSVVQTSPANYFTYYGAPALTVSYPQQRWITSTIPAFTPFVATSGVTPGTPPYSANVISISGLLNITKNADRAEGFFPLLGVSTGNNLAFLAKGVIPAGQLSTSYTVIRRGGLFNNGNARIQGITSISQTASPNTVTVTTAVPHGLIPGTPIYAVGWLSSGEGVNGNYFLESVPNTTTFTYTPRQTAVQTGIVGGYIFVQTYSSTVHRPFDGGVLLAAGQPTYGSNIVRQSKKVFRYQSGKGLLWSSGTLFAPNNDIVSISSAGTAIGSLVSMVSEIANGLPQAGAKVEIVGVTSTGFNTVGSSFYTINNVVESTTATTLSLNTISGLTPTTAAITSISGNGTTVTVNSPEPSSIASILGSGSTVTVNTSLAGIASISGNGSTVTVNTQSIGIANITGNGTTVTVTTSGNHLLTPGVGIVISGTTNYNTTDLVFVATTPTGTQFTYVSTATGGTSGGTVTSPHGLSTGLIVTIAGTTNYNTTTAVVLTAPSTTQFTYASTTTGGSSGGTVTSPHGLSPGVRATITGTTIFNTTTAVVSTAPSTTQFTYASTVTTGSPLYTFATATFNGTTGQNGPSLGTAQSSMTGTPAPSTWYSTNFTVTSGIQYWTVPATGTYNITAQGAQGGSTGYIGGRPARMQGDFTLIKGEIIAILVGQLGVSGSHSQGGTGASGGGGTFVVRAPYNTLGSILVIAGGGGGSAQSSSYSNMDGRPALIGTSGNTNNNGTGAGTGGYGAPYMSGHSGSGAGFFGDGSLPNTNSVGEQAKAFINGGTGGRRNLQYGSVEIYGGFGGGGGGPGLASGGGGGFSGGAEGVWTAPQAGGGGGSYNSGTNQVNQENVFTGAGFATITLTSTRTTGIVSSPHGLSTGLAVAISGTTNYNTNGLPGGGVAITVTSPTQFTYASTSTGATSTGTVTTYRASLTDQPRFIMRQWHGASVRAGCFEDQNGLFWEYDGQTLFVVKRSATFQLSGLVSCPGLGQTLTGDSNTRFLDQIRVGERFVMRGMTHTVTTITSQNTLTFNPPYRGATEINTTVPARISKVKELRVPQSQFNRDKLDGTGSSAYTANLAKMQMIGLQYTWYGAGFVDFMMRGADGNWVYAHRFYNNNVNDEAYMRTGNMPVRYELVNECSSAISTLGAGLGNAVTASLTLTDDPTAYWPTAGTVQIDNEMIAYTGKTSSTLTGLTRSASLVYNIADTNKTFTGSTTSGGDVHTIGATVILVSTTCTPSLTHWGSALLMDGSFDNDRGYFFNYTFNQTSQLNQNSFTPLFFIRLAPSASNGIVGDIGARDLLNRAQLLLQKLDCSVVGGGSTILNVNGILNPVGFENSTFPWLNINTLGQGSQPSFTQFCNFSNVVTNGGTYAPGSGERIFSLIAQSGSVSTIDLSALKELSNTVIGGNRMFPDGPDTLMIAATPLNGTLTTSVLNLYWTEAQA